MTLKHIHGVIAYVITPFTANGHVDIERLEALTDRLIADGVHGLAPLGAAGLLAYLSDEEREAITETVCRKVAKRVPTVVGVSSSTTEKSIRHAIFAEKAGADALLAMPASDWKLTPDEIFHYYDKLAGAVSLPIMVYDTSMRSGGVMSVDLLLRLSEIPNVTMVKDSSGDAEHLQDLILRGEGRLDIFVGKNTFALAGLMLGCQGWCTASPLIAPRQVLDLHRAISIDNDVTAARRLGQQVYPLLEAMVKFGLPRSVAAALELIGATPVLLRDPMKPLAPSEVQVLARALEVAGVPGKMRKAI